MVGIQSGNDVSHDSSFMPDCAFDDWIYSRIGCGEVDPIVWTKIRLSLDEWSGLTMKAAVRPPSIPGLSRRSGRIPALLLSPPIKHFDCTTAFGSSK